MCQTIKENHQMTVEDLKVLTGTIVVWLAIDFSRADAFLKFLLTAVMIVYTVIRIYIALYNHMNKPKNEKKDETEQKED
jgi:hypothetical protein